MSILIFLFSLFTPQKEEKEHLHSLHLCMLPCHVTSPKKEQQIEEIKKEIVKKETKKETKKELPQEEALVAPLVAVEQAHEEMQKEVFEPEALQESMQATTEATQEPIEQEDNENIQEKQSEEFIETNFSIIRDMAMKNLIYPKIARKRGWSGTTTVALYINVEGKLTYAIITESSGKEVLDDAALRAVLSLKNKNLPQPTSETIISLPISFSLR